jgi:hypothetical protein
MRMNGRRWTLVALAGLLAALLALHAFPGCGREPPAPHPDPAPLPEDPAQPQAKAEPGIPREWNPTPEEIAAAPASLREQADEYTVRFVPGPSRAMLEKKADVYRHARPFFLGTPAEREAAGKALREIGIPAARFLVDLAGVIVPKANRPPPDPERFDEETPEDRALEVVKEIMSVVLKKGDVDEAMLFFAAATGKIIEMDAELSGTKFAFRFFKVHPLPALFNAGDALGCDMGVVDHTQPVIPLFQEVLLDLRVHGEDVRWLLENLARLGKFRADLGEEVRGPVDFRIRAKTYADAFQSAAARAGYKTEAFEGGFRVGK